LAEKGVTFDTDQSGPRRCSPNCDTQLGEEIRARVGGGERKGPKKNSGKKEEDARSVSNGAKRKIFVRGLSYGFVKSYSRNLKDRGKGEREKISKKTRAVYIDSEKKIVMGCSKGCRSGSANASPKKGTSTVAVKKNSCRRSSEG